MKNSNKGLNITIYLVSIALSVFIYGAVKGYFSWSAIQTIRLTQIYAIAAAAFLYLTLLIEPLRSTFPSSPLKKLAMTERALGVSAFYFALLHVFYAFFGQLGGFAGLKFLDNQNLFIVGMGLTALMILALFAAGSLSIIDKHLLRGSKIFYKLLYIAGMLIIAHAVMMRVHFANLSSPLPLIFFFAVIFLILLNAPKTDAFLEKNLKIPARWHVTIFFVIITAALLLLQRGPWSNLSSGIDKSMDGFKMTPVENR